MIKHVLHNNILTNRPYQCDGSNNDNFLLVLQKKLNLGKIFYYYEQFKFIFYKDPRICVSVEKMKNDLWRIHRSIEIIAHR